MMSLTDLSTFCPTSRKVFVILHLITRRVLRTLLLHRPPMPSLLGRDLYMCRSQLGIPSMNTINPDWQVRDTSHSSSLKTVAGAGPTRVYNNTLAKRILFNNDKRATGVLVNTDGLEYTILAGIEVILSSGAFQSPQLLMVSGVGPTDTLKRLRIPIVSELKCVGQNMEDHFLFDASYEVNVPTHAAVSNPAFLEAARDEYR
ncbi:hypothetical protein GGS23DRAFT_382681 [Durotheca rogersii]|uniref:uncharacterized protein n=1 Tax=Durotheca rogersii TaxID=419775 RepID=UPI00221EE6BB|nr:uncharacterized protein GGS23DRAFT_382681 [Durotheca rogersii]KAI5866337.1 hypothetical protein GGS23DRAFT_382681 [Durotheca rogersii]